LSGASGRGGLGSFLAKAGEHNRPNIRPNRRFLHHRTTRIDARNCQADYSVDRDEMRLMSKDRFRVAGSGPPAAALVAPTGAGERVTATIYVRRNPSAAEPPSALEQARQLPAMRTYLSREQAARIYGAAPEDLVEVAVFAASHGLEVIEQSAPRRSVRVAGPASAMNKAFGVHLHTCRQTDGTTFRGFASEVTLPTSLADVVEGVLGLDNRRMAHSHLRTASQAPPPAGGGLAPNTYLPTTLAQWFDFPSASGSGECVAVLAFNGTVMETGESTKGGYDPTALDGYFTQTIGQPAPTFVDVVVQGPGNDAGDGSNPDDSTGEVLLDLCVIGSVAPAATIAVYFTEFTEEGWVNAIKHTLTDTANAPSVVSISYGNPEDDPTGSLWSQTALDLVADAFQQAATQGMTICVASGDNGAADEPNATTDHVDFPASSPWVLGCGGTRLETNASTDSITAETTWNDLAQGNGATGGGVSRLFPVPDWQVAARVPPNADGSGKTGRGVPDVASLADPETPLWVLGPAGQLGGVGGTSAAAPMWSALIARCNQGAGHRMGFLNPLLYAQLAGAMVDITTGSNGAYQAGPGWDACTGWGRPDGSKLLAAITAATTTQPAPPTPGPHPQVPATPPSPGTPNANAAAPSSTPYLASIVGPQGQLFADPSPGSDEVSFQVDNTSEQYYSSPYYRLHQEQLQPVPAPAVMPPVIDLTDIVGPEALATITAANRISFHAVGDTGSAQPGSIVNEASVADAMTAAVAGPIGPDTPAFFFHLGDVIYNFGEGQYYYDQLYEPFRGYNRPIIAIPGNHDGSVFGPGTNTPQIPTLTAFLRNFCAATPGPSPEAGAAVRTTMNQPGVYFTLDAPCVSIIGLYSNVLEGPGVISSEGGHYPIGDEQIQFLAAELERLKPARQALQRAVVLAVHHPPVSADATHGGTLGLSNDIDTACTQAGIWPDVILSGHAHLYQRFTRTMNDTYLPYIVSGSGGYGLLRPQTGLGPGSTTQGEFTLVAPPIYEYGYLTVSVDLAAAPPTLAVAFATTAGGPQQQDSVSVDLSRRVIV
jgi:kumamolisin